MSKAIPLLIDDQTIYFEVDPTVTVEEPEEGFIGAEDLVQKIDQITSTILQVCRSVHEKAYSKLEAAKPKDFEIEFGVTLAGEVGIPLVSKGSAEAQIKITARW
jgi:hypothetical protein